MRKTPLRRGKPLKAGKPLVTRARIKPVNPARLAKRREKEFGPQSERCREMPCCVCGRPAPSDPHHTRHRKTANPDAEAVPLCRVHHDEAGQAGRHTFDARYGVDLEAVAQGIAATMGREAGALKELEVIE